MQTPEDRFANLESEMIRGLSEGKPYCVAWGDFYDAQFRNFADFYEAASFVVLTRQQMDLGEHDAIGLFYAARPQITTLNLETGEIPF